MMTRLSSVSVVILAVSGIVFVLLVSSFWPFTVDDAFITFRYSSNVAQGYGATYNPGPPFSEGYTTFLWMLLMVIPHLVGLDVVTFSKIIGVASTVGYMFVTFKMAQELLSFVPSRDRYVPASVSVLMLATFYPTSIHAVSGMETALFTLLLTSFLYLLVDFNETSTRQTAIVLSVIALLAGLTRPEGNIAIISGLVFTAVMRQKEQRVVLAKWVAFLYIIPAMVYFSWRWLYYDHLLPLPFYVKIANQGILPGIDDVVKFTGYMALHVGVLVLLGMANLKASIVPPTASIVSLMLFLAFPEHIMDYNWRYFTPVLPFVFVMLSVGLGALQVWMNACYRPYASGERKRWYLVLFGLIAILSVGFVGDVVKEIKTKREYARGLNAAHIAIGKRLSGFQGAEFSALLSTADAGAIPYYSRWRVIDTYGLNNDVIAVSGKIDPQYVLSQGPDLLILLSRRKKSFVPRVAGEQGLYREALNSGMIHIRTIMVNHEYFLWLMVPPNSGIARYLERPISTPYVVVDSRSVNARSGPGVQHAVVGKLTKGEMRVIVGEDASGAWWKVCCLDGEEVWIAAPLVDAYGDVTVPVSSD